LFRFVPALLIAVALCGPAQAAFDLVLNVPSPGSFTPTQYSQLISSLASAESLWEHAITGYQPGISLTGVSIDIFSGSSFAETSFPLTVDQAGFRLATSATIRINPAVIDAYFSWNGAGPPNPNPAYIGLNYLDDILAHEIGHALGIGPLWEFHGLYISGSGQYTGEHGMRAYRADYNPLAAFIPVELAGNPGTIGLHWNQLMRSSTQEGNPGDPWSLSPLTGITDDQGRDLALELLTGALDPDHGEPYLSRMTVQSLRDLGFTVVPEPNSLFLMLAAITIGYRHRPRNLSGVRSRRLSTTSFA
jgi:hypothetical protein